MSLGSGLNEANRGLTALCYDNVLLRDMRQIAFEYHQTLSGPNRIAKIQPYSPLPPASGPYELSTRLFSRP